MIPYKPEKKTDYRFIIISLSAAILLGIFSMYMDSNKTGAYGLKDEYLPEYSKLVISEVVSSNPGVYVNLDNEVTDYVELFNGTDRIIDLTGYGLSDREDRIKWSFPQLFIEPGEYLVVSLSGNSEQYLCAPFRLSSDGGERIILTNSKARIIDGVDTMPLKKGEAMVRDEKGNWKITDVLTPGFENSNSGLDEYHNSLISDDSDSLIINEFLTSNNGDYIGKDNSDGYIELFNNGDSAIDLSSYYLSDDNSRPFLYHLSGKLDSGKIMLIDLDDSIFNLRNSSGGLYLSKNGKIINSIEYRDLNKGMAYIYEDGQYYISSIISPGYSNDIEGVDSFQKEYLKGDSELLISEVMNHNSVYLLQNGNKSYDWIELFNNSDGDIALSDYAINTDKKDDKCKLPDITLKPQEYYVLMCSGDSGLSNDTYHHLPLKFGDNEGIYLYRGDSVVDSVYIADVPAGYSYGRYMDEGFYYLDDPSPYYPNTKGIRKITDRPLVSVNGGVYSEPLKVNLYGRGDIYYTTDGSNPDKNAIFYDGSNIVLDNTTTLKAVACKDGERYSDLLISTYIINEDHSLPILSLSLDTKDFLNLNAMAYATGIEKQCFMELFENGERISSLCSLSLFGGNARSQDKKAYCVRFDSEWGASELNYKLFDNRDNSSYDAFVLRCGSTDWVEAVIKDIVGTSLVDDYSDLDVQAYKPVVLYINGRYWGLYNMREKVNPHFIVEHHNVSKDSVNIFRIDGEVECGSKSQYDELRQFCKTHDLKLEENYRYVCDRINVTNLADYWISEGFFTNHDLVNCRLFSSDEYDEGRFHYILYDLDFAWYNSNINWYTEYICNPNGLTEHMFENDIIINMMKNDEFRDLWLERLSYHLNNTFKEETVIGRIDEIVEMYEPEIVRDRQRWNVSYDVWKKEVENLRVFTKRRIPAYLNTTQSYFHLSNQQMKEIFKDVYN